MLWLCIAPGMAALPQTPAAQNCGVHPYNTPKQGGKEPCDYDILPLVDIVVYSKSPAERLMVRIRAIKRKAS